MTEWKQEGEEKYAACLFHIWTQCRGEERDANLKARGRGAHWQHFSCLKVNIVQFRIIARDKKKILSCEKKVCSTQYFTSAMTINRAAKTMWWQYFQSNHDLKKNKVEDTSSIVGGHIRTLKCGTAKKKKKKMISGYCHYQSHKKHYTHKPKRR